MRRICHRSSKKPWWVPVTALSLILTIRIFHLRHSKTKVQVSVEKESEKTPYEKRWPGWDLPYYAQKSITPEIPVPADKETCFVHVGKTAGSTIGCSLGFQLHCSIQKQRRKHLFFKEKYYEHAPILPGVLPQYTLHTFHREVNDCREDVPNFLFAVREPLSRAKSAYAYDRITKLPVKHEHHKSELYLDCPFDTLNNMAERGLAPDGSANETCKERAYDVIRGNRRYGNHLYFNYRFYANRTIMAEDDDTRPVLLIRTEHLSEDWNSAEQFLGGVGETASFTHQNKDKRKTDADRYLSEKARALVCEALCDEIQVYKLLLRRAVNLNATQVEESMQELRQSCPKEADLEVCPET